MAKEGGVDLSEVFATFAKLPNGKNREKEGKIGVFDDFGYILPNGKMANVAKSLADTFSDKLAVNDLPDVFTLYFGQQFSSAVYRALEANGGSGMIFETEADTLTNMISNKEYGNYSDLLRRAFHHETVSMVRVTDQVNIEIEEPRLAVIMTCTGSQLVLLRPGMV